MLFVNFLFSAENARHHKNAVVHQGGSAGHNLNLKSLSSVLSTTCTNLERRIVVFSNPIFRWPNFLNVPKPMDSPLLCTAGRQRMTWFSSRHFHYIAIIKFWYSLSFSTVLREKCHLWHYFKSCFLFRWPVKKTGWTNQSLWLQSPRSTSMKEGDVKSATQRNCMDHYQL